MISTGVDIGSVSLNSFGPIVANIYEFLGLGPQTVVDYKNSVYSVLGVVTPYVDVHLFEGDAQGLISGYDADGKRKHSAHNVVPNSEDLGHAYWTRQNMTATPITPPVDFLKASRLTLTAASNAVRAFRTNILTPGRNTCGFYVRQGSGLGFAYLRAQISGGLDCGIGINTNDGTLTTGRRDGHNALAAPLTARSEPIGDGWFLVEIEIQVVTTVNFFVYISDGDTTSFGGTIGSYVDVTGCYIFNNDIPVMDVPAEFRTGDQMKYVRTDNAARYLPWVRPTVYKADGSVTRGIVVAPTGQNILPHSKSFDTIWTRSQVPPIAPASETGTDGQMSAFLMGTDVIASGTPSISQLLSGSANGIISCVSFVVKKGTHGIVSLGIQAALSEYYVTAVFDLDTITQDATEIKTGANASVFLGAYKEALGGGYYRLNVIGSVGSTSLYSVFAMAPSTTGNSFSSLGLPEGAWAGTETVIIDAAQFEPNAAPSPLIATKGSAVTRPAFNPIIKAANHNIIGNSSGVLRGAVSFVDENAAGTMTLMDCRVDESNRITMTLDTDGAKTGNITLTMRNGGATASITTPYLTPGINRDFSISWRVTNQDVSLSVNGAYPVSTATEIDVPDLSAADLDVGSDLNGFIDIASTYTSMTDQQLLAASRA